MGKMFPRRRRQTREVQFRKKKTSKDKVMTCSECMKNRMDFSYGLKTSMAGHRQKKFQARRNKTRITYTKTKIKRNILTSIAQSHIDTLTNQENKYHHIQKEKLVTRNNVNKTFEYTAQINQLPQRSEPTIAKIKCVKDDNMIAQHDAISHIQSECSKWIPRVQRSRYYTSMAISKQIQFVPDVESKVWNDHIYVAPVFRHENEPERSQEDQSEPTRSEIQRGEIVEACSHEFNTHVDLATIQNQKHLPLDLPGSERALQNCASGGQVSMDGGCFDKRKVSPCDSVHPKTLHCNKSAMPTHSQKDDCSEVTNRTETSCSSLQNAMQPSNLLDREVNQAESLGFEPLMHIIDKIADGERVPPQITMRYELLRFCTLRSFPKHNKPYISKIAQAGFYFANTDDEVVCYCCARRKSNWREDDVPSEIHRELNPNCSFLLRNLEVNVPVRMSEVLIQDSNRLTYSQILQNANQTRSASTSDTNGSTSLSSITANKSAPNVTQAISSPVVSANSEIFRNRLQSRAHDNFVMTSSASSFVLEHQSNSVTASNGIHVSPVLSSSSLRPTSQLSAQGFRNWSEDDDPWITHSIWSKDCLFVKQVRGQEFVNIVQYFQNTRGASPIGSSSDAEIERQMHTDAAQSVLEMGYNPRVIRSALRAIRDGNDGRCLSATILMEKILDLEDETSANDENNQLVQGAPRNQSHAIAQAPVTVNNNTQSQRVFIDTVSASSNSARTQSGPVGGKSSQVSLTTNASSEATRTQNKQSQLLEQKKLKQEKEQLKQQSLCIKCKQNDVCIVFLPCGHLVTCETCAPKIRYCSVESCGKYIKGTVRAYLAKTGMKE